MRTTLQVAPPQTSFWSTRRFIPDLADLGLSDDEIQELLSVKSTGIYLINGVAYDKDGNKLTLLNEAN
ncbi:hypothetical protein P4H66_16640 [Paenibacillus dokdonensis]|uniref:Uncharacterized protein n=1 Tax=Paenibacillus dokdonensis TaxID=2567944 RepID=A0ABU6GT38_9BACL|nr:hypothetical protein [Paenibacillus dokdonensis]MEC0241451.1 hypothetical protein [Paenibacillus dokdonensis]